MADSKSEELGDVAKAAVEALALSGATVVKRKTPMRPEGAANALPEIVVSVGEEGRVEFLTAAHKRKTYPVAVTIVNRGGTKAGDDPTTRDWREQIEQKLEAKATWAGVTGFILARVTNRAPFDSAALGKDFNYSTVVADVELVEART